jgi:hypothetical protein
MSSSRQPANLSAWCSAKADAVVRHLSAARPTQGRFETANLAEVNCGQPACISGPSSRVSNEDLQYAEINTGHEKEKGEA